jgi:hypothetical protein
MARPRKERLLSFQLGDQAIEPRGPGLSLPVQQAVQLPLGQEGGLDDTVIAFGHISEQRLGRREVVAELRGGLVIAPGQERVLPIGGRMPAGYGVPEFPLHQLHRFQRSL